jgi:Mg-chelatase subunit ChlD
MKSLTVDVKPAFAKVDFTKDTKNHLMLELKGGPAAEVKTRPPLDLIAVVDVSSSMGSAMKMENVKKSLRLMVNHLSPGDFLTVIEYASDVRLALPRTPTAPRTKQTIFHAIGGMNPSGMTNFSAALVTALDEARNSERSANALKRIIFFSDGCPTTGDTDPDHLIKFCEQCPAEWAVTTMAYGRAGDESRDGALMSSNYGMGGEVNLDLLDKMARAGRGNFYYMRDADSAARAFASELGGLISTVAQDIRVVVTPKPARIEIAEVLEDLDVEDQGDSLIIRIPDLMADETKFITMAITCRKQDDPGAAGDKVVSDLTIQFLDVAGGRVEHLSVAPLIQWVEPGLEDSRMHEDVAVQLAFIETVKAQEEAFRKAEAGDFAGATSVIDGAALAYAGLKSARVDRFIAALEAVKPMFTDAMSFVRDHDHYKASMSETKRGRAGGGVWTQTFSTPAQEAVQESFTLDADEPQGHEDAGEESQDEPKPSSRAKKAKAPRY